MRSRARGATRRSWVMGDGELDEPIATPPGFRQEFGAKSGAAGMDLDAPPDVAGEQLERAINVASDVAKGQRDDEVPAPRIDEPNERVAPGVPIPDDDVRSRQLRYE